jgi:integrase
VEKETFSPGQIVALLKTADRDWSGMVLFAYNAGARLSDAANLKWSNLDVANGIITYQEQKTGAKRPLDCILIFGLVSEQPVPEHADAPVFPSLAGKAIGGTVGLSTEFTKLVAKAGIQNRLLRTGNSGKGRKGVRFNFSLAETLCGDQGLQSGCSQGNRPQGDQPCDGRITQHLSP